MMRAVPPVVVGEHGPELEVAQARGRLWTSLPYVFATAYGMNAALRTAFAVELLQIPDWVWTDRTKALRRSVQQVTWNTLSMGNAEAFYAVYVEAWGAPVRKAYDAALEVYGYAAAGPVRRAALDTELLLPTSFRSRQRRRRLDGLVRVQQAPGGIPHLRGRGTRKP